MRIQFYLIFYNGEIIKILDINTDLGIDPNSIPYIDLV